jgi:hypothetical protein
VVFLGWPTLADLESAWASSRVAAVLAGLSAIADLTRSHGFVGEEHRVK